MIPTWQRLEKVNTTLQSILTPRTQINRTVSTIKTNNTNILGKGSEKNKKRMEIHKFATFALFMDIKMCKFTTFSRFRALQNIR